MGAYAQKANARVKSIEHDHPMSVYNMILRLLFVSIAVHTCKHIDAGVISMGYDTLC